MGRIDPSRLTLGSLRAGRAAFVGTGLTVLRGSGKIIDVVADIPFLVSISALITPDLNRIAIGKMTATEVQRSAVVGPVEMVVDPIPLLVLITRITGPNLKFRTVGVDSVCDIETKAPVNGDATTGEFPLLIIGTSTVLNSHFGTVGLGSGGKTFGGAHPWLN